MSLTSGPPLRLSDTFVISCGTITLDPVQARMLLIRYRKDGQVFFPKGRKNIGETLEDAAVRETYEETGFRVTLLPLRIPTLATPAADTNLGDVLSTEPVAVAQFFKGDTLKLIFWFSAKGDSTATPDVGTQEEGEDFDPFWADLESAVQTLTYDDDKHIAQTVVKLYVLPSTPRPILSCVHANLKYIDSEPALYLVPRIPRIYQRRGAMPGLHHHLLWIPMDFTNTANSLVDEMHANVSLTPCFGYW